MIGKARKLLNVQEKVLKQFSERDPFNDHTIEGYLSRHGDHRYGAMAILSINEEPCEQVVWATPKLHYPFDKHGKYIWPSVDELEIWEKLDGTNILAYRYTYNGRTYITYKTRLSPVLKASQFGDFLSLWKEYLEGNPWVEDVIKLNPDYNLSFELYGSRNQITVEYEEDLAAALLFGVRAEDHAIRPPSQLKLPQYAALPRQASFFQKSDLEEPTAIYQKSRTDNSVRNQEALSSEGDVFYVHTNGKWVMFKCKPEEIEKIHWTTGGIPKISIYNTCMNAYEDTDDPDVDYAKQLLLEEYTESQIEKAGERIAKLFKKAKKQVELKRRVNGVYRRAQAEGFDIKADKRKTLRWMSQFFERDQMKKVGTVISAMYRRFSSRFKT